MNFEFIFLVGLFFYYVYRLYSICINYIYSVILELRAILVAGSKFKDLGSYIVNVQSIQDGEDELDYINSDLDDEVDLPQSFNDDDPEESNGNDPEEPNDNKNKEKDWGLILGRKGKNVYAHQLAKAQLNSGKPVTLKVLNEILAYSNILVSEETLNSLLNMPRLVYYDLHKQETINLIYEKLGSPYSKTQVRGIYIFTCLSTNQKYVGSSNQLSFRLKGYLNFTHRSIGKLIPLMKELGFSEFKLEVICLPYYPEFRPEIVLEQYYLLDPSFSLNTIRVSNNPSGSASKALYMYNRDKSILYYSTDQQKDFISKLSISHFTFTKHLTSGTYYLGKYLFLREKIDTAKLTDMSLPEIALMLTKDRIKFNVEKPVNSLSKIVVLINVLSEEELEFESLGQCVKFLRSKGFSATQTTLAKYLNTDKSYKGYICITKKK